MSRKKRNTKLKVIIEVMEGKYEESEKGKYIEILNCVHRKNNPENYNRKYVRNQEGKKMIESRETQKQIEVKKKATE